MEISCAACTGYFPGIPYKMGDMGMIHIAVVEDDSHDRARLKKCLERYEREMQQKFEITEFSDGEDIITDYTAKYDLIILDIEMTFMNGMSAAQRIREMDSDVELIFVTNMPQYAIQGYKVNALDYMLKPISYFSFTETMNKALKRIGNSEKKYVVVATKGGKMKLDISGICYVEVLDHLLLYHTTDGTYEARGTLKDTLSQLDERFFSCSRSFVVNLDYVEHYRGNDLTVNGDILAMSRGRRNAFLDALNVRMNGEWG